MKKLLTIITLALTALLSGNAFAAKQKCEPAKFERLYNSDGKVFVQLEGMPWHVLGFEGDNDLAKKMDKIHKAKRKNRWVQLVLSRQYNGTCFAPDHTMAVKNVRVKKKMEEFGQEDET